MCDVCVAGPPDEGHRGWNAEAALGASGANGLTGRLGMLMEIVCDVMNF